MEGVTSPRQAPGPHRASRGTNCFFPSPNVRRNATISSTHPLKSPMQCNGQSMTPLSPPLQRWRRITFPMLVDEVVKCSQRLNEALLVDLQAVSAFVSNLHSAIHSLDPPR